MRATSRQFTETAKALEEPLLRYATRILGDRERARDVVQDALLKFYVESEKGRVAHDQPQRWLYTVCRNRALDVLRRERRVCALDDVAELPDPAVAARGFERRAAEEVVEMFDRLPPKQRKVMEMRFRDDEGYREIGEATGISTGHVGYLVHHGVQALRSYLGVAIAIVIVAGLIATGSSDDEHMRSIGPDRTPAREANPAAASRAEAAPVMPRASAPPPAAGTSLHPVAPRPLASSPATSLPETPTPEASVPETSVPETRPAPSGSATPSNGLPIAE